MTVNASNSINFSKTTNVDSLQIQLYYDDVEVVSLLHGWKDKGPKGTFTTAQINGGDNLRQFGECIGGNSPSPCESHQIFCNTPLFARY